MRQRKGKEIMLSFFDRNGDYTLVRSQVEDSLLEICAALFPDICEKSRKIMAESLALETPDAIHKKVSIWCKIAAISESADGDRLLKALPRYVRALDMLRIELSTPYWLITK